MSDSTIQELFELDPLQRTLTDNELERIIERCRAQRAQYKATGKAPTKKDKQDLEDLEI